MVGTELGEDLVRRPIAELARMVYTRRHDVQWTVVDGQGVLVDLENDTYFSLNQSATMVWEVLVGESPVASAVEAICARFDVSREVAAADVTALVERLLRERLIV